MNRKSTLFGTAGFRIDAGILGSSKCSARFLEIPL